VYPTLGFIFLQPEASPLPNRDAREAAFRSALADFGALDLSEVATGRIGPDRDTQFLEIETGVLRITLTTVDGACWTLDAADLERVVGRPWGVSSRHARARVEGARDWRLLWEVHDAITAAFATLGLREQSFLWSSHVVQRLRDPLREAGHARDAREIAGRRAVAWLEPDLLLDAWSPTLDLRGADDLDLPALLAAIPAPERFTVVDLRSCGLRTRPEALARYGCATRVDLDENPLDVPG
jgi:hypothetical protein